MISVLLNTDEQQFSSTPESCKKNGGRGVSILGALCGDTGSRVGSIVATCCVDRPDIVRYRKNVVFDKNDDVGPLGEISQDGPGTRSVLTVA